MLVEINSSKRKPRAESSARQKVYIKTFGCQMNEYDTQKLRVILKDSYDSVEAPEDADLILVNTCSVREKPEHKLFSLLGELRELKDLNPNLLIGVGGCVAQQEGTNIIKKNKAVDLVFGTHNLSLVPSLIERRQESGEAQVAIDYRDEWEDLPTGLSGGSRVSALVSISRGCNKNCTYCIVPTTRGKEVSRDPKEIAREVRIAAHRGAKEVMLLGQTVNSYGLDFKPRMRFSQLLDLVSEIDGIQRIRFISPHPQEVRPDFIECVTTNPKVCRHIHMPLQSGSDSILKAMNRNYRKKRYLDIISALRERVPDMAITTDIIVGFPGETREDFEETMATIELVQFDNSYLFMFSPRPGTEAAKMDDDVSREEKLERLQILQEQQLKITEARLNNWIGQEAEVLLDGPSNTDARRLQGRLSQNIVVNLNQSREELEPGQLARVKITSSNRFSLQADFVAIQQA